MTISISLASSNNLADSLNADIGAGHKLVFREAGGTEVATAVYSGSGVVTTNAGQEIITFAHANYTDDVTRTAGTISYATIETSADLEVVRFTDPVTEISLSGLTGAVDDTVDVNADIVLRFPANT